MQIHEKRTSNDHVRISLTLCDSEDFRNLLAVSRDSYPMGLGRLIALCLKLLQLGRSQISRMELDRTVQWPADRKLRYGEVLEQIGWAKASPKSTTLLDLMLPTELAPRKPPKDRAKFKHIAIRQDNGQFASRPDMDNVRWKNKRVQLITLDGLLHNDVTSVTHPEKMSNLRRGTSK